jgi:uncharacterized protein YneF (UPF0154 family)
MKAIIIIISLIVGMVIGAFCEYIVSKELEW